MTDTASHSPAARANRWLLRILAASTACTLLVIAIFILRGDTPEKARDRTVLPFVGWFFSTEYHDDSWGPMARAFLRSQRRADGDIYGIFFDEGRKFQYPPTSLLGFFLMPAARLEKHIVFYDTVTRLRGGAQHVARTASQLAVLATIAASIAILETGLRRLRAPGEDEGKSWRIARVAILALLGLAFYPAMKAHQLGQIQVFLNALTAAGVLAHLLGRQACCGVLLGLCCLVKPQLGVVLVWAALRRNWRLLGGFLAATVPLGIVSLALFGWDNHLRYLDVIREIARLGEAFWPNQSVNGFTNRLLGNGDPANFSMFDFAPYQPLVHFLTMGTSLVILGLALFVRKPAALDAGLDLAVIIAAATLASPVAWEHHYGAFLPLFALALPACLERHASAVITGLLLGVSYLAISVAVIAPDVFFSARWCGWMSSYLFFGAVLLFGLLLHLRRPAGKPGTTPPSAGT
jgi:hypothetical protein